MGKQMNLPKLVSGRERADLSSVNVSSEPGLSTGSHSISVACCKV